MNSAVAGNVLCRSYRLILVRAVTIAMIIMMVGLALKVHHRVILLGAIGREQSSSRAGKCIQAHAQHQEEGDNTTAHGFDFTAALVDLDWRRTSVRVKESKKRPKFHLRASSRFT